MKIEHIFPAIAFFLLMYSVPPVKCQEMPFQGGENISMVVHYKWGVINADIAKLDYSVSDVSINGEKCYHVYLSGTTYKFWDNFFKVRDVYETKVSVADCTPRYFHRDVQEGSYTASNVFDFDPSTMKVNIRVEKGKDYVLDSTLFTGGQIYDIVSAILRIRCVDFSSIVAGKPVVLTIAMDRNMVDARFRFVCREKRKIDGLGTFNTVKLAASVRSRKDHYKEEAASSQFDVLNNASDVFSGDDDIVIWFSDDSNRLPLCFETPVSVGSVRGRIKTVSNQKYPIDSKIGD
ncbi:MAG: DUF3108 domain-containing protein [Bacteroidales bacterium]|jgi:hypothetical protein|nr:DUF3108 domain-containing protein [Bacteroidales bacterium]MCI2122479.1 DUF3108 domain-containing protein [Bacteroidales bacterium]MCI2146255.1 DUF3108 domain-containing protein [Bacteroidales bacterium]